MMFRRSIETYKTSNTIKFSIILIFIIIPIYKYVRSITLLWYVNQLIGELELINSHSINISIINWYLDKAMLSSCVIITPELKELIKFNDTSLLL